MEQILAWQQNSACQKRTEELETHPARAVPSELNAL